MLNTQSRLGAALIWLVILAIVLVAAWTLLALGHPIERLHAIANSPVAGLISRNQVAFTGLTGFGALAFAYLFNGWRDRAERRHATERTERRMADVLAREAAQLSALVEKAALGDGGARTLAGMRDSADCLLLAAPMGNLARLGPGATMAIQALRGRVRRLAPDQRDDHAEGRRADGALLDVAFAARDAHRVLTTLAECGQAAADRLRLLPPTDDDVARLTKAIAEAPHATRLLPAA